MSVGPSSQHSIPTGNYKSKVRGQKKDWDDSSTAKPEIPEYRVTEDKFASGYLAGLKRQKRLKTYLNQVYVNGQTQNQQVI